MYSPEPVAKAILYAAEHKRRSITVGGTGKFQVLGATMLPWLFDRVAAAMEPALLDKTDPAPSTQGNLRKTHSRDGHVEGRQHGRGFSLFTAAGRHRWTAFGIVAALAAAGAGALVSRERL
jgi:hypothetical protein